MSFEDAVSALEGAIETDNASAEPSYEQAAVPTTPEGNTTPDQQVQPHHAAQQARDEAGRFAAQQAEQAQQQQAADTFDGGRFNPDALPPELQQGWKQLQAAYTQKTQEVAEQRRQFEGLGDPQYVRQAVEFANALQDPNYLVQFHRELSQTLEARGLSPAQASAVAAQQIESQQGTGLTNDQLSALKDDPDLAPIANTVQGLQQKLEAFEAQQQQREQHEQMANLQMALAGELQRQEMTIRQMNPAYKDSDLDAIYELSAYFDGNLLSGQQRYEQIKEAALSGYIASKESVAQTPGVQPLRGVEGVSNVPTQIDSIADATKAALGMLQHNGITEWGAN